MRVESLESVERVDSVIVESSDSVTITKTVTITVSEAGDTLKQDIFTDRLRIRDRVQLKVKSEKVKVVRDTVYVERRDSVFVQNTNLTNPLRQAQGKPSFTKTVKWLAILVIAIAVLVGLIKIKF